MAEMITKDLLNKADINNIEIYSRGLSVFGPSPLSPHVETILSKQVINISSHCSRILLEDDLTDHTLILTMTDAHKQLVNHLFPTYSNQTYTLSEYVIGTNIDIQDPYGGDLNTYKECFFQLEELLAILVKNLLTL